MIMVNLYEKFKCYKCEEKYIGRDIIKGSAIGSGFFTEYMCEKCTKENYIWATGDDLLTEYEKENIRQANLKINRKINKILLELGGVLTN